MSNLYKEAIDAAEELKRAAEDRAKKQIIESISPKIKMLVEKAIDEDYVYDEDYVDDDEEYEYGGDYYEDDYIDEKDDEVSLEQEEFGEEVDPDLYDEDLANDPDLVGETYLESEESQMSNESTNLFKSIIDENEKRKSAIEKLKNIRESILSLKKAILLTENAEIDNKNVKRIINIYKNLLKELKNISSSNIIKSDVELFKEYKELFKELNQMSRRRSRKNRFLNESLEDLLEMNLFEDEEEEDTEDTEEEDVEEEEEVSEEEDSQMIDPKTLQGPVSDLSRAAGELADLVGLESEGEEGEEDFGDIDLGDIESDEREEGAEDEDDEDLEEMYDIDEDDEDLDEMYETDEDAREGHYLEEDEDLDEDPVLEIDEEMLKTEIAKMRRIREGEAKAMASHFGGGKLEKEMFVDIDDSLLNKHDKMKNESALRRAAKKNRMLESKISQYKKNFRKMKTQLTEMNLFNAKLLYANKLMQNRSLSLKQQKHIVESLDNAKTINEAKLLFESLSKSQSSSRKRRSRLSEGNQRKLIGSSSRSTSSAQSLNESVALDRWATLAGIKK